MESIKILDECMVVLQDYCCDTKAFKCREEDFQLLRTSLQKMICNVNKAECRIYFFTKESYLRAIVYAMQELPDRLIRVSIVRFISRLLNKSSYRKHAPLLIQKGLTRALFHTLHLESIESIPNEEFIMRVHQLLCRVGHLDRRFGIRARLGQCLPITLCLLRSQNRLLQRVHAKGKLQTRVSLLLELISAAYPQPVPMGSDDSRPSAKHTLNTFESVKVSLPTILLR